jgi:hypothetical protein
MSTIYILVVVLICWGIIILQPKVRPRSGFTQPNPTDRSDLLIWCFQEGATTFG